MPVLLAQRCAASKDIRSFFVFAISRTIFGTDISWFASLMISNRISFGILSFLSNFGVVAMSSRRAYLAVRKCGEKAGTRKESMA